MVMALAMEMTKCNILVMAVEMRKCGDRNGQGRGYAMQGVVLVTGMATTVATLG